MTFLGATVAEIELSIASLREELLSAIENAETSELKLGPEKRSWAAVGRP
ncbi:hypothetical protein ABIF68_011369 [Bradyrhizobium japonicum]|jgi:hypothetical protein